MIRSLSRSPSTQASLPWNALGISLLVGLLLAPAMVRAQERGGRAFTPEDALDVRTARIQDVSDDGAWLIATVLGCVGLAWNGSFVSLWIGPEAFAGRLANLVLMLLITQQMFMRADAFIVDTTLSIRHKVLSGIVSAVVALSLAAWLGERYGIVGVATGMLAGRSILTLAFPALVGAALKVSPARQLAAILRPGLTMALILGATYRFGSSLATDSWVVLVLAASATALLSAVAAWFLGLTRNQRTGLRARLASVSLLARR